MKAKLFLAAGIAVLSFSGPAAYAEVLYAVDYPASATLYTVNETSGALTAVGPVGIDNVGDLTSDLVSQLWGIQITTNSLVSINPSTGAGTLGPAITGTIGAAGGPAFPIVSLAYDPLNSTLYGNTSVPYGGETADELYSINTTTGAATAVGLIGENSVYALGFSQAGGLYGVDGNCNLVGINTGTGAGTIVGSTGLAPNGGCGVYDMASGLDGTMYLADALSSSLYDVNLGTGGTTLIGPYGSSTNVVGLAVLGTATPEPGTVVLFATGMVMTWLGTRRRKHSGR
jgi:hypothetical protein